MELDPAKLKRARQSKAMTQAELATAAKMRQATISDLERGDDLKPARMSTVRRIAEALSVEPIVLLTDVDQEER